ncbi:peptidase inhibitor family I36 protein [Amycolatopsis roodepoortensis]|uniref:Uncharacterized protein n=1 Tax=Amycolatopsis roodepoortensis TaxID=700274 RepID=A0ABR9LAP4_9PSEU|nr:hypothetical protein [Amycolatopsis roodepoortensis]
MCSRQHRGRGRGRTGRHGHADNGSAGSYDGCPAGSFCAWDGRGGTGRILVTEVSIPDLGAVGMDNQISSIWNRTGVVWCAYDVPSPLNPVLRIGNKRRRHRSPCIDASQNVARGRAGRNTPRRQGRLGSVHRPRPGPAHHQRHSQVSDAVVWWAM